MKRRFAFLITAAFCAAMLAGCGGNGSTGSDSAQQSQYAGAQENIVVVADTQCPTSLDLAQSWDSWYTSRWGITETLFQLDDELTPQPFLAEDCEMIDERTWKITLRDDVTFHNGSKLTAESVKLCWERTAGINARFGEILYIDTIEADGQVLTVKTSKIVPGFKNGLCEPLTGIIDVTAAEDPAVMPVGTGPFKPVSYEPKSQAVVEKYAGYWGGEPKADGAVLNIIGDTNTLTLAQQSGESDVSVSMPGTSLELFNDESLYNVDGVPGSRGQVIFFNFRNAQIQENAIRQAISMIIDKPSYANILNKGASVAATGLYPDFMACGADKGTVYDMEGAAKLLDDAGIVDNDGDGFRELNGQKVSLRLVTYSTKAELPNFCNEISSSAKKVGLEIKVEIYESVAEHQKTGDFDMLMVSFTMTPTGDPQYFADIAFRTGGSSNYGAYSNAEVDALIDELDQEFDAGRRTELAKQIQDLIVQDVGFIVISHCKYYYVMGANVQGLKTNPSEYYLLNKDICVK